MTNRQWIESLTDRQLAEFLTFGIMVRRLNYHTDAFRVSIHDIARQYTSSTLGVESWLSATQEYAIIKGGAEE